MIEFGLTGGIGSGKSTVGALLVDRGAVLIDADAIVRTLQVPGELVFVAMHERWGDEVLTSEGSLDRRAVAAIVFADDAELAALNAIVHPAVAEVTTRMLSELGDDAVVVHDIPLLVQPGGELLTSRDPAEWAGIIVVDTPVETAIDRVVASRGMERAEVMARMANQATREERRKVAGFVIDNSGDRSDLDAEVDRCWAWIQGRLADRRRDQAVSEELRSAQAEQMSNEQ